MVVGTFSGQVSVGSAVNTRSESYEPLREYNFWMLKTDGTKQLVYHYKPASIEKCMEGLNAIRATLPEDGTVHFVIVPVAQSANWWLRNPKTFSGWESNAEEYMEVLADDGEELRILTEKLSVQKMHESASALRKAGHAVFFAAVREA